MLEITVLGYGNQGKAWAANLRDSGWRVSVSGRDEGRGIAQARADGFATLPARALRERSGPIALLLPDESIAPFYAKFLAGGNPKNYLFAHGFAVTFTPLTFGAEDDVILVAPKGIGTKLRENFLAGGGVMGAVGVRRNGSGRGPEIAQAVAEGLGLTRVGVVPATFEAETKCDLLSEQVILCGAVPRLVRDTTEFLVRQGIDRRLAAYECLNELKLIVDMMVEHGVDGMLARVSTAARFGGEVAADVVLPRDELEQRTQQLWDRIEDGSFARSLEARLSNSKNLGRPKEANP